MSPQPTGGLLAGLTLDWSVAGNLVRAILAFRRWSWYKTNRVQDEPLTRDQAKVALNSCLEYGTVVYTKHFREELASDDLTMEDVLAVCRSGAIVISPEKDIKTGQWKYRIEGSTAERRHVAVIFSLRSDAAVFITVWEWN